MRPLPLALCATLVATAAFAETHYVPNHIKYRDTGHQAATGRSGGASIQALALIDKSGLAEIEIAADAPGTLQHVQIKTDQHTSNYHANSPALTATLPNAGRGTEVQIQANVAGTDGPRTGVVTVTDTVALRPDLVPGGINAPATAPAATPVEISAIVQERNGDTGARATCVLRVDGQPVDRATNIWVDAGGSVSCVFLHAFATAGERQLEVGLEDVAPRDYDDTNNRASGTIRITEAQIEPTSLSMNASEGWSWMETRAWSKWGHTSSSVGETWMSAGRVHVNMAGTRLYMDTMQLSYSEKTEGATIVEMDPVPLELTPVFNFQQCGRAYLEDGSIDVTVCQRYKNDQRGTRLPVDIASISIRRESTDISYYSHEAAPAIDGSPAYDNEWYSVNRSGPRIPFGNTVTFKVNLTDGAQSLDLDETLTFHRTDYPYSDTTNCWGEPETTWCQEVQSEGWFKEVAIAR
jgi:hypothetical protein